MRNEKNYHRCCQCGKIATWVNTYPTKDDLVYFCDDCVPRGCSDNLMNIETDGEPNVTNSGGKVMWWKKDASGEELMNDGSLYRIEGAYYYEVLDNKGRRFPCDLYNFNKDGYERKYDEIKYYLKYFDVREILRKTFIKLPPNLKMDVEDEIFFIFEKKHTLYDESIIDYNVFMCKLSEFVYKIVDSDFRTSKISGREPQYDCLRKFYLYFKDEARKIKVKLKDLLLV